MLSRCSSTLECLAMRSWPPQRLLRPACRQIVSGFRPFFPTSLATEPAGMLLAQMLGGGRQLARPLNSSRARDSANSWKKYMSVPAATACSRNLPISSITMRTPSPDRARAPEALSIRLIKSLPSCSADLAVGDRNSTSILARQSSAERIIQRRYDIAAVPHQRNNEPTLGAQAKSALELARGALTNCTRCCIPDRQ